MHKIQGQASAHTHIELCCLDCKPQLQPKPSRVMQNHENYCFTLYTHTCVHPGLDLARTSTAKNSVKMKGITVLTDCMLCPKMQMCKKIQKGVTPSI